MLELEVVGDRNKFIDSQKFLFEKKCKILRPNGADLRTGTDATNTDLPYFSNTAVHLLFSECTVLANDVKMSNTNGNDGHKASIETEFSSGRTARTLRKNVSVEKKKVITDFGLVCLIIHFCHKYLSQP